MILKHELLELLALVQGKSSPEEVHQRLRHMAQALETEDDLEPRDQEASLRLLAGVLDFSTLLGANGGDEDAAPADPGPS